MKINQQKINLSLSGEIKKNQWLPTFKKTVTSLMAGSLLLTSSPILVHAAEEMNTEEKELVTQTDLSINDGNKINKEITNSEHQETDTKDTDDSLTENAQEKEMNKEEIEEISDEKLNESLNEQINSSKIEEASSEKEMNDTAEQKITESNLQEKVQEPEQDTQNTLNEQTESLIIGKKITEIVPDERLAQALLNSNFKDEQLDTFILTEQNIQEFTILRLSGNRNDDNYDTINFEGLQYFTKMRNISIYFINIDHFPSQILELKDLITLTITGDAGKPRISNTVVEIPEAITELTNLKNISFNNNLVKELPEFLSEMPQLTYLNFSGSNLNGDYEYTIPESYVKLKNLHTFYVSNNHIHSLPSNFHKFEQLNSFSFVSNELLDISSENYQFIKQKKEAGKRFHVFHQYHYTKESTIFDKTDVNGFSELTYPPLLSFLIDNNNENVINNLQFSLYSTEDNYDTLNPELVFNTLVDSNQDGVYESKNSAGQVMLKYNTENKKFMIKNSLLASSNQFRLSALIIDDLLYGNDEKQIVYADDFTTDKPVQTIEYQTIYKIDTSFAEGVFTVEKQGEEGLINSLGTVLKPVIDEIRIFGPKKEMYKTVYKANLDLAPGKKRTIQNGKETLKNPFDSSIIVQIENNNQNFVQGEIIQSGQPEVIEYGPAEITYDTIRVPNLDLAPGEEEIVREGVVGRVDEAGTVLVDKVDQIIAYGPAEIAYETIREPNLDLAPGEEEIVTEGFVGRIDDAGTVLVDKVDQVIEYGPIKDSEVNSEEVNNKDDNHSTPIDSSHSSESKSNDRLPQTGEAASLSNLLIGAIFILSGGFLFSSRKDEE